VAAEVEAEAEVAGAEAESEAEMAKDEKRRRHFVCGYISFMQVALAVCGEIKI